MSLLTRYTLLLVLLTSFQGFSQSASDNSRREAQLLMKLIYENHFEPRKSDDTLSIHVFDSFLTELDPDHLYFTKADINSIQKYRTLLDDELNGNSVWSFLNETTLLYKKCLNRSEQLVQSILQKPFTWSSQELPIRLDTTVWASDDARNRYNWERWLKYKTLQRLYSLKMLDSTASINGYVQLHEASVRKQVMTSEVRAIHRILNHTTGFQNYITTTFLRCVAMAFDPHTVYFSANEMENFVTSLSAEGFSFGLALDENAKGEVIISYLIPGGPAWKSGEVHTSDVLTHLKWEHGELIDLFGLNRDEVGGIMDEINHDIMELTVRKAGGIQKTVRLRKEKLSSEENVVRSFLIKGENTIGYISLPGFYSDWDDTREGHRCANDVAKEIMKLSSDKIDGLILDLRFNQGGSMQEAVEMAGIFIDQGPLGIIKDRLAQLITVKDVNRGTVYDGPLIIMVNRQSASASEFVAAVLQDYNRALIVGSQTFGKATAQNMFALDPSAKELDDAMLARKGYGYATITMNKIYRVNGKSIQGKGVTPHIALPDILDKLDISESSLPGYLIQDSVNKKTYYSPLAFLPAGKLQVTSNDRTKTNSAFNDIKLVSQWLNDQQKPENNYVPLSWNEFIKFADREVTLFDQLQPKLSNGSPSFTVTNNSTDINRMEMDEYAFYLNNHWSKNLSEDTYLKEAFQILCDYIHLNK